jgi:hypothetical protein
MDFFLKASMKQCLNFSRNPCPIRGAASPCDTGARGTKAMFFIPLVRIEDDNAVINKSKAEAEQDDLVWLYAPP